MVLAKEGLFFVTIEQTKKSATDKSLFKIELKHTEKYFPKQIVKGAFEYETDRIIALVDGSENIRFINRLK